MNTCLIKNGEVVTIWLDDSFDNGVYSGEIVQTDFIPSKGMLYTDGVFSAPQNQIDLPQRKMESIALVTQVFGENLQDIDLKEQQEFLLFYSLADQGFTPDITKHPLVLAQVQEWITQDKLPNIL